MASDSFLRLKGRVSYFRRKIPAPLQTQLASTEICFRLGVINRDSALHLGRRLAVAVDAFFVSARRNEMLSSHQLTAVLGSALQEWRATIQPVPEPLISTRKQAKAMAAMPVSRGLGLVRLAFVSSYRACFSWYRTSAFRLRCPIMGIAAPDVNNFVQRYQ